MSETLIDYRGVEIRRNEHVALRDVNWHVESGEFVYLLGNVGSGKTSLMKTVYAEVPVVSGQAMALGYNLCTIARRDIPYLRRRTGIVFQDFQLLGDRTAWANLDFVLGATGWRDKDEREARIEEVLRITGIGTKAFKMPHQLSGGEQQRVAIARALLNRPPLILADEPTGNLDPDTGRQIMSHLFEVSRTTGTAVVVATHNHSFPRTFPGKVMHCDKKKFFSL